ncbi:saccharopine dehydrogenase C-terminal domain-containing protein [Gemmatimonas sp.]|uniref:saccharopine dehydrogenase family protein n=1 Tax=Gemmatimonas sp. TaxID=1962908 RepID=UPI0025C680CB|nr:saccharopine dehydrogenase C-terminal domain-containing protein [Gemmatimonas sp.]MCA2983146.1 saccharopine dehydrogenase NADP-binding domain-containing protein [Gemmatimonas sp.]MCA2986157.1 saccharopine dehydrogenase NADP-binding domain-containing protein [Gemmatimonas sp.]MCA2993732.1 saccharopine dehydrogenase NADP-binding domain-containing protein [Gemmatimonas sp.]MCE2953064.1 saccharopine dehydrogenase NADP-binding domain-containing protein [Gemmatimonas sp.]
MRMLVLGAGLQGSACAFDLLREPAVTSVQLADMQGAALPPFLQRSADSRLMPVVLDVRDEAAVREAFSRCDAVMSAIPYYFNAALARLAVEAGVHFTDLGGNTQIVQEQRQLHDAAVARGVSVVPDTGLAPGMVNVIAQHAIDQFETVESVKMFVGGLPQHPEPPLGYQIAYSIEGMVDYYTTPSLVVRDGQPTTVTALSELESVDFAGEIGTLEAFHTAGGLSTMVYRYAGRIPVMEYKTLRYPGHAAIMAAIRDLGLLGTTPVNVKGTTVAPRDVFVKVAGDQLRRGKPDLVALRVVATGTSQGQRLSRAWEVVDRYDAEHGLSAMMRTTGYTLSITGQLQAGGAIAAGVHTPDECIPAAPYFDMLGRRGIVVREVRVAR